MKHHLPTWLLGLCLLPVLAAAQSTEIFHENGKPTDELKQSVAAQSGLELLSGADLVAAYKRPDGIWDLLDEDACIVLRYHVNEKGVMDRYVVLDSEPEKMLESASMMALANWRFSPSEKGAWLVQALTVSVSDATNTFASETRLKKASKVASFPTKSRVECVVPTVKTSVTLPGALKLQDDFERPLAPRDPVRAKQTGCATLVFGIRPDGTTADFEMLDAKPGDTFVTASAVAVSAWRFPPASRSEPRRGFVRFDFGIDGISPVEPASCMEPAYAAAHYQPATKESP